MFFKGKTFIKPDTQILVSINKFNSFILECLNRKNRDFSTYGANIIAFVYFAFKSNFKSNKADCNAVKSDCKFAQAVSGVEAQEYIIVSSAYK